MTNSVYSASSILFGGLIVLIGFLSLLLIYNHELYTLLSREDKLFEYLSAVALFIAGIFFLLSVKPAYRDSEFRFNWARVILLAILGVGFLLTAGEEISWGQRIFGIATPEALLEINDQDELNFHNINKRFFDDLLDRSTILFVGVGMILLFTKIKKVLGLSSPDIFIICSFAITPFYHQYGVKSLDFHHIIYLVFLAAIIIIAITKQWSYMWPVLISIGVTLFVRLLHIEFHDNFFPYNNSSNEYKEFMFACCCAVYSFIIFKNLKHTSALS